jgi:hypothetical protein
VDGAGRTDLFDRLRIADDPVLAGASGFADAFRHGVADPTSGRIGWEVPRPALAAAVVRREALPPALCPSPEH